MARLTYAANRDKLNSKGTIVMTDTSESLDESFLRILMHDVLAADEQLASNKGQTAHRNFIRALFAAIEGAVWVYRQHTLSIAKSMEEFSPEMALAFSELSYSVSETGKVVSQPKYVSLTAMIRLTTRLAHTLSDEVEVDFSQAGWSCLQQTMKVRNRVTHPKEITELTIEQSDIDTAWKALLWLMRLVVTTMDATTKSQAVYLSEFREIVTGLISGDPDILREYRAALRASDD